MARVKFYNKETGNWEYADSAYGSGGTVTDEQIASAVEDYLEKHPIEGGNGEPGADGQDGFSPVATVSQTSNGATITITDKNGTTTATVVNGKDGKDGQDGAKGETGEQGEPGKDGANGKDGTSASHSWNGTVLTITSTSGTSSADLKGTKGDKGDKGDTGAAGAAGKTPVKGVDYWTEAERAALIAEVLDSVVVKYPEAHVIYGDVDANNIITIYGELPKGIYMLKYEDTDGNAIEIGTVDVGKVGPAYTNLFNPDSATLNKRWSNSSYALSDTNGYVVSDFIPVSVSSDASNPTVLRFRGGTMAGKAGIIYYNSSKTILADPNANTVGADCAANRMTVTIDENGDYQTNLGYKNGEFVSTWTNAGYIRVCLEINATTTEITADDIQNIIITIDEPIEDGSSNSPAYVNMITKAEALDSTSLYNNTGYKNGYYASSATPYENADANCVLTGLIPYDGSYGAAELPSIYIKGASIDTSQSHVRLQLWKDDKTYINGITLTTNATIETLDTNYYKVTFASNIRDSFGAFGFIRMSLLGTGDNLIITIGEPIE